MNRLTELRRMPTARVTVGLHEADRLFEVVTDKLREVHGQVDENRLRQAYELGLVAHEGQTRLDGSPYITHPLEVAEIAADLGMDEDSIIAAILHDTVEDTSVRLTQIRQLFGPAVATMVESLTKIKKIDFFARFLGRNKASNQARNLQKLFVAMTRDSRVIVIKLCDRLHNMHTLGSMPAHKQQRISKETLEFYIPLARRLGLGQMAVELEDLTFRYLYPEEFASLERELETQFPRHERIMDEMVAGVKRLMAEAGISIGRVYGRRKHLWSIYQKMLKQGVGLDGIYDLLAIRIILDGSPADCYRALGVLHLHFKPIFHRFRDFIGSPKENGYQTLHTTIIGPGGTFVECQIRTTEMDLEAEKGIAAHWRYKEVAHKTGQIFKDESWMEFIRELVEEDVESDEFVAKTRDTLLGDQVLVLSPKGEVVDLPAGSTPIDFAYYIHTDLGHAIRSAKVNGAVIPLDYTLQNGDVVEVFKGDESDTQPRPEWLVLAQSPKSLLKVRRYFKGRPLTERVNIGRSLLRQQIIKEGLYPLNLTANDKLVALLRRLPVRSIDDLYDKVALGMFSCEQIIHELKDIHRSRVSHDGETAAAALRSDGVQEAQVEAMVGLATELGVARKGGEVLRVKSELMDCCTPIPGDRIYGVYDRKDRRLLVHRLECAELQRQLDGGDLMELEWEDNLEGRHYPARIQIVSMNRVGLLFEILRYLSQLNVNLGGAVFGMSPAHSGERNARFELVLEVADREALDACRTAIARTDDVFEVSRVFRKGEVPSGERH
jgi:GTP diphosphokinase / guanosine-3',5'-bis(diphosphate) 3'-diphosphatase